jgi:hypothetical protein
LFFIVIFKYEEEKQIIICHLQVRTCNCKLTVN